MIHQLRQHRLSETLDESHVITASVRDAFDRCADDQLAVTVLHGSLVEDPALVLGGVRRLDPLA